MAGDGLLSRPGLIPNDFHTVNILKPTGAEPKVFTVPKVYCGGVLTDAYLVRFNGVLYCGCCHRKIRKWVWPA